MTALVSAWAGEHAHRSPDALSWLDCPAARRLGSESFSDSVCWGSPAASGPQLNELSSVLANRGENHSQN